MADSTTNLDTISPSQSAKETTANALFDAMAPNSLYGRRASTTSGLTWGYYGGVFAADATSRTVIANGTVALTASTTNYVEADTTTGAVSVNTTAFTSGKLPLYEIVTGASTVTSYEDWRTSGASAGAVTQPYDLGASYPGAPTASLVLVRYPFPRAVAFPASMTLSRGVAAVAATAQTDFDLQKNAVSFGTMRFAAAGTTASFIAASSTSFAAGDILTVVSPASPDATLASIGFSLAGTR
jgi:hypothetical protein